MRRAGEGMILAIGYGNRLRRDDGAGVELLRMVAGNFPAGDLRCIETQQLLPELAAELAAPGVTAVLFFDARAGREGEEAVRVARLAPGPQCTSLGHHLSPEALLAFAWKLYGSTPPAWLVTVAGEDFGHGEGLSAAVRSSLDSAREEVVRLIQSFRAEY